MAQITLSAILHFVVLKGAKSTLCCKHFYHCCRWCINGKQVCSHPKLMQPFHKVSPIMGPKSSAGSPDGLSISTTASIPLRLLTWDLPCTLLCIGLEDLELHALLLLCYVFLFWQSSSKNNPGIFAKVTSSSEINQETFLKLKASWFLGAQTAFLDVHRALKTLKHTLTELRAFANLTCLLWINVVDLQESQTKWIMCISSP